LDKVSPYSDWKQLAIMSFSTTAAAILVTFFTPETDKEVLEEFYKKVKPEGWWGKTAAACGDDPKEPLRGLRKSLFETATSAVSLFCLLVGCGKLMFRPMGDGVALPIVLILIGLALIPVWLKAFKKDPA